MVVYIVFLWCCTFGVKSILNPVNVAFDNGFRKNLNVTRHTKCKADY